jgi:hypothetical protein
VKGISMTEATQHQALADPKPFEGSAKSAYQATPPVESVNPTSEKQGANAAKDWDKANEKGYQKIAKPNLALDHSEHTTGAQPKYPFSDLELGEGLYIAVEQNSTTDKLMEKLYKDVANARIAFAEVERDENGDEIWDVVVVKTRKRNEDGTFQMGAYGKPLEGASQTSKPRLVFSRHFAVKAVIKDDDLGQGAKAPHDGALVVRQV